MKSTISRVSNSLTQFIEEKRAKQQDKPTAPAPSPSWQYEI